MAGESGKDVDIAEKADMPVSEKKTKEVASKKKSRGLISRIWHGLFSSRSDDFERRLERISKEEAAILSRMRRRHHSWAKMKRHLILFSVLLELIAVSYAIMTAASAENWKKRAFRVLPMFLLPALSSFTYTALRSFNKMHAHDSGICTSSVLTVESVQNSIDAAKQYLADPYQDITKFQEEVMALPISGIEAILCSNDLQVESEDYIYDFLLEWARTQYRNPEERREILGSRLARCIRFPYMSYGKLGEVLTCPDFDHEVSSKFVLDALFIKAEAPHGQCILPGEDSAATNCCFLERAYMHRPVKVLEFKLSRRQLVVYLDLKKEECANLYPSGQVYSQTFHLGKERFLLSARCIMDQQSSCHYFGLFLVMKEQHYLSVAFGVAARAKPSELYCRMGSGSLSFKKEVGDGNLFFLPWKDLMADDSEYFMNGILHVRVLLTITDRFNEIFGEMPKEKESKCPLVPELQQSTDLFNDSDFSNWILNIEVMASSSDSRSDFEGCDGLADWAHNRMRRREDFEKENGADVAEEQVLNEPDADNVLHDEAVAMIEESPSGDEAAHSNDSSWSRECYTVVKVIKPHTSPPVLAAQSLFFSKLFSYGMKESQQKHVTLRIDASEETALMDLLSFMSDRTLKAREVPELLDVLMTADKFDVPSCMRRCVKLLLMKPMTPESALLYLELPSSVLVGKAVQHLINKAKKRLAKCYRDITKFQEKVMALPISGIEAIFCSNYLQVESEDYIYDFLLEWARTQYPNPKECREILGSRLARCIRFPYMSYGKLGEVLTCPDFDHEVSSKFILEALFFKAEAAHGQHPGEDSAATNLRFLERAYKQRTVKVVGCDVYLTLKKKVCAELYPSGDVFLQEFHLGGHGFSLVAACMMDRQSSLHYFGLWLRPQKDSQHTGVVYCKCAARKKPYGFWQELNCSPFRPKNYPACYEFNYCPAREKKLGHGKFIDIPWEEFMAYNSPYFINNILHLRVELPIA